MGDDESFAHAADEPTAMWDEESLQDLALDAPDEQKQSVAATRGRGGGGPSVEVSLGPSGRRPQSKISGLSWGLTILLALGLGAGVYFLVRFLK